MDTELNMKLILARYLSVPKGLKICVVFRQNDTVILDILNLINKINVR